MIHSCSKCGETDLLKFYFRTDTKKPQGLCKVCHNKKSLENYYINRKERLLKDKFYRETNKDKIKLRKAAYYLNNKEYILKRCKSYRDRHSHKYLEYSKKWRINNLHKYRVLDTLRSSDRRARKLNATYSWMSEFDEFLLEEIYDLAALRTKLTGIEWHVDHIIPLKGDRYGVCGLHHPCNLQVITKTENLRKGNRLKI